MRKGVKRSLPNIPEACHPNQNTWENTKIMLAWIALAVAGSFAYLVTTLVNPPTLPRVAGQKIIQNYICRDSDGGKRETVAGVVELFDRSSTTSVARIADSCNPRDNRIVNEMSCEKQNNMNGYSQTAIRCRGICQNGACVDPKPTTTTTPSLVVYKHTGLADRTATNPTGLVGQTQTQVAAFVVSSRTGEPSTITSITLRDDNAGVCAGSYLNNLTLNFNGTALNNPILLKGICTPQNEYIATLSSPLTIKAGSNNIITVLADLKAPLMTTGTSLLDVDTILAYGATTQKDHSIRSQNISLQSAYIVDQSTLVLALDSTTPSQGIHLLGSADQGLANYTLTTGPNEDIMVRSMTFGLSTSAPDQLAEHIENIKLIDKKTGTTLGTVSSFMPPTASSNPGYLQLNFNNLSLVVPKSGSRTVGLLVSYHDYAAYKTTGQTYAAALLPYLNGVEAANAVGMMSGSVAKISVTPSNNPSSPGFGAFGNPMTIQAGQLNAAWDPSSPSGIAVGSISATIAKVQLAAQSTDALLKEMHVSINSTISIGSSTVVAKLYKDSISNSNVVATAAIGGPTINGALDFKLTNGGTEISAGQAKTFIVTLDTTSANTNQRLSVSIPMDGIIWSNGSSVRSNASGLPLFPRTILY